MTQPFPHASPALDELLHDLDQRKSPSLFGINPGQFARGLRGNVNMVGKREVGLSSVEELILEAHRDELASLLSYAAIYRMTRESETGRLIGTWTQTEKDKSTERPERDALDLVQPDRFPDVQRVSELHGGLNALCLEGSSKLLAILACRLVPAPRQRLVLATVLGFTGSPRSAIGSLLGLLRGQLSHHRRSVSLQNAAVFAWRVGNLHDAIEWSREAAHSPHVGLSARVDYLSLSVRSQEESKLLEAGDLLGESTTESELAFSDSVQIVRQLLETREGATSSREVGFAQSCLEKLPGVTQAFLLRTFCSDTLGEHLN